MRKNKRGELFIEERGLCLDIAPGKKLIPHVSVESSSGALFPGGGGGCSLRSPVSSPEVLGLGLGLGVRVKARGEGEGRVRARAGSGLGSESGLGSGSGSGLCRMWARVRVRARARGRAGLERGLG